MKLNVHERILMANLLPALLPEKSTRFFYASINKVALELSLTDKEIKHIGLKTAGEMFIDATTKEAGIVPEGQMKWQMGKQADKNVDIPKSINDLIVRKFQEWDKKGELSPDVLLVFDRFVGEAEWFKEEEKKE